MVSVATSVAATDGEKAALERTVSAQAERLRRAILDRVATEHGKESATFAVALSNLAELLRAQGRLAEEVLPPPWLDQGLEPLRAELDPEELGVLPRI